MKASDNPHAGYDDYGDDDDDDDDDSGTVTFLGVSHNSSLGNELREGRGFRIQCPLMGMVSTLTRNNVTCAIRLTYNWQKSKA